MFTAVCSKCYIPVSQVCPHFAVSEGYGWAVNPSRCHFDVSTVKKRVLNISCGCGYQKAVFLQNHKIYILYRCPSCTLQLIYMGHDDPQITKERIAFMTNWPLPDTAQETADDVSL